MCVFGAVRRPVWLEWDACAGRQWAIRLQGELGPHTMMLLTMGIAITIYLAFTVCRLGTYLHYTLSTYYLTKSSRQPCSVGLIITGFQGY